ncbi:MAG: hypothetical protein QME51_07590 [Planctomycetota bacterium]|nr:hypothetical protein [Planctomycetota bacterium]MDI6788218.1 hypothetical protein [Planctomycetota bacterium]
MPQISQIIRYKKICLLLTVLIIAAAPFSCSQVKKDSTETLLPKDVTKTLSPKDSTETLSPEEITKNIKSYQSVVEKIRGLQFKSDVTCKIQSLDEFREYVKTKIDESFTKEGKWVQLALSKLGLIPSDYNLRKGLEDAVVSQAAAYYSPETKCFYLLKSNQPALEVYVTIIHELTHALQDQYYNLDKLIKQISNDEDKGMAFKYLIEGEATYVMTIAMLEKMGMTFTTADNPVLDMSFERYKMLGRKEMLEQTAIKAQGYKEINPELYETTIKLNDLPPYIFWSLIAPYYRGAYSIHKLVTLDAKQRNWKAVDELYKNLPSSSEQMIHITKLKDPRDDPSEIAQIPPPDGWTTLYTNSLGEFGFWVLYDLYCPDNASKSSKGWDGDKYFLFQHNKTEEVALSLSTVWDSDKDARESFEAYQSVMSRKYPNSEMKKEKDKDGTERVIYDFSEQAVQSGTTQTGKKQAILTLKNNTWISVEDLPR